MWGKAEYVRNNKMSKIISAFRMNCVGGWKKECECKTCGTTNETVQHIIFECKAAEQQRNKMRLEIPENKEEWTERIREMLTHETGQKMVCDLYMEWETKERA